MKRNLFAAGLVASLLMSGTAYAADSVQDWKIESAKGRCTAWTMPKSSDGRDAFMSIVNVPSEGVKNSVAFTYGNGEAGKFTAKATINGNDYELLTFDKSAFAASGAPEAELIAAMKKGSEVVVRWDDGKSTVDTYSLVGFSSAKDKIDAACR